MGWFQVSTQPESISRLLEISQISLSFFLLWSILATINPTSNGGSLSLSLSLSPQNLYGHNNQATPIVAPSSRVSLAQGQPKLAPLPSTTVQLKVPPRKVAAIFYFGFGIWKWERIKVELPFEKKI